MYAEAGEPCQGEGMQTASEEKTERNSLVLFFFSLVLTVPEGKRRTRGREGRRAPEREGAGLERGEWSARNGGGL